MKDSIMFRGPRSELNSFPLAKTLKFEELFTQNFSRVRKIKRNY